MLWFRLPSVELIANLAEKGHEGLWLEYRLALRNLFNKALARGCAHGHRSRWRWRKHKPEPRRSRGLDLDLTTIYFTTRWPVDCAAEYLYLFLK